MELEQKSLLTSWPFPLSFKGIISLKDFIALFEYSSSTKNNSSIQKSYGLEESK